MSNAFTSIPEDKINLHVNTFDWSHENNLTTKIGQVTPVLCLKVPPKTSLSFDAKYAFQLMPMVFPIQTPISVRMSFYKMPLRAMWKNYQDWISSVNLPHHSNFHPPFVSFDDSWSEEQFQAIFGTKSLGDYFGLPTTFDDQQSAVAFNNTAIPQYIPDHDVMIPGHTFTQEQSIDSPVNNQRVEIMCISDYSNVLRVADFSPRRIHLKIKSPQDGRLLVPQEGQRRAYIYYLSRNHTTPYEYGILDVAELTDLVHVYDSETRMFDIDAWCDRDLNWDLSAQDTVVAASYVFVNQGTSSVSINMNSWKLYIEGSILGNLNYDKSRCPWYNTATFTGQKLIAYPWRMYDAIYNTFIRNLRNNPLYDIRNSSLPLYNKVTQLLDHPDGISDFTFGENGAFADMDQLIRYATPRFANWEPDQFSTAVPSPMEGIAPLVGLTTYLNTSVGSDGITTTSLNQYLTDEDGKTYKVNIVSDPDGITDVNYTSVDQREGTPITNNYQAIQQGVSIADLRNVNAYTRFLELNQRRGYRYKDIIEGRFDVKVRYDELLMPEFIGGFTRQVTISPVTQTVQTVPSGTTYDGSLGSKAGDGFTYGSSDNRISCYCDEESFIMGIISFVPRPVYTQTLPKFFTEFDVLDSFNPEFNNLGFQPILNKEIAPIQFYNNNREELNHTFGYQRPWYQYVAQYDTAHGDFRGSLRNFLMHRVFSGVPRLSESFLLVKPEQVNDVFNVTEDTDKIFGQVVFDMSAKLGVARDAVPRLE